MMLLGTTVVAVTHLWFWLCFVTDLPRVLSMPVQIYLPKGMMGRISCPTDANPAVTTITWTKNEKPIDVNHSSRIKVNKQGTLVIKNVISADEGRYMCTPYSALGAGKPSSVVQILVKG